MSTSLALAKAQYSASVLERETTICFLLYQEIKESPRKKQKPVVDHRSLE